MESEHEMQGSGERGKKVEEMVKTWRGDLPGIFFAGLLAGWVGYVALQIAAGNTQLWRVFVGAAFFEGASRALQFLVQENTGFFRGLAPESRADFLNTCISLLHSTLMSLAVVGLIIREAQVAGVQKMLSHDVLYSRPWPGAYTALATSCGYFAYDQWDMLRKHLYNPRTPSLLVHHAVLLTCFTPALQRNLCINYLILTLVCEVHSIFLHLRKVNKLSTTMKSRSNLGSQIAWILNWTSFLSTRLTVHMYITVKLIRDASKFPRGFEWPMAIAGMLGLNLLNLLLGQGLYKAFMREKVRL